jgi:triosephosphate isomerase
MTSKNIIIANWKMNSSFDKAQTWIDNLNKKLTKSSQILPEIVLCPPSIMIDYVDGLLIEGELEQIEKLHKNVEEIEEKELEKLIAKIRQIKLGGQDCSIYENGAFTGDISAFFLKEVGAKYVILGHSERRQHNFESDDVVAEKIIQATKQNLVPILCVGESKEKRQNNNYQDFINNQLKNSLPKNTKIDDLIIAYEPIWSIGSGKTPTTNQIAEIAELITKNISHNKNIKNFRVIYGGSVNSKNAQEILQTQSIKGLLVGGASLEEDEFFNILNCNV